MILTIIGTVILIVCLHLSVSTFLLRVNGRVKYSVLFCAMCYLIWTLAYMFLYNEKDPEDALFWYRIASLGFLAVPGAIMLVFASLSEDERRVKYSVLLPFFAAFVSVLYYSSWTGKFCISGFVTGSFGFVEKIDISSPWLILYLIYFVMSISFGLFLYYGSISRSTNFFQKQHSRSITIVTLILVLLSLVSVLLFGKGTVSRLPFLEQITGMSWLIIIWLTYIRSQKGLPSASILSNQVIDIIDDMLFVVNHYNNIVLVNPAALKLLGYGKKELIGKEVSILFEEDTARKVRSIHDLLEILSPGSGKIQIKAKNGSILDTTFSVTARSEKFGEISWIVLVFNDIRELLKIEQDEKSKINQLRMAYADLENTQLASLNIMEDLNMKSIELETAYNHLKETQDRLLQTEKMAVIGKLAGGIAHEINNPMTVILGYSQSVMKRIKEEDTLYKPLKAIEREALRSKRLIDDLLTYSRTEKTVQEEIDVNQAVESSLTLINALSKVKNIEIVKELAADLPLIRANKNQLQQVIINLTNNALDAILERKETGTISIRTFRDKEFVNITVVDDGAGMDNEIRKKIFEPFYTTKEVGKGTGLGLSLCYEIIKKHNGEILVESEVGKGSKFTVKLPIGGSSEKSGKSE
ncbi:MAG: hypothetical protein A2231_04855 [Candidatus Firestonebacteria bacterium RIFOXYA2_FULL_40_8]|nr:MAG: hypothetical protein A2231_04855 [Candidatus Firestonebacteria bacterium RIFOXYA2_FULL_40_8]